MIEQIRAEIRQLIDASRRSILQYLNEEWLPNYLARMSMLTTCATV